MVEGGPRSLGEMGPGHPVSQRALEEAGETGKTLERWKRHFVSGKQEAGIC